MTQTTSRKLATVPEDGALAAFEAARPRLWSLAYRLLGSAADAEDAVQATWLRWQAAAPAGDGDRPHDGDGEAIRSPEAWLVTACTRLCLDLRRAADRARVDYVGMWLPEPVVADPAPDPAEQAELASSLSFAFLHLLERLSPAERAAYLLREVFDYGYAELAPVLGRSEPACRQLVSRARRALAAEPAAAGAGTPPADREPVLLEGFLEALRSGDPTRLEGLLAEGVEVLSDHGGKATAATRTVRGRRAVSRLLAGLSRRYWSPGGVERARLNGRESLLLREAGRIVGTLSLAVDAEGRCLRVFIQRNPDKLAHLRRLDGEPALPDGL